MLTAMHKPTLPEVTPYIKRHYHQPGNTLGGCFHIMTEDPNPEYQHALWCLQHAIEDRDTPEKCGYHTADDETVGLGVMLCLMSVTQRKKLHDGDYSFYPEMMYYRREGVIYGFAGYVAEDGTLFDGDDGRDFTDYELVKL